MSARTDRFVVSCSTEGHWMLAALGKVAMPMTHKQASFALRHAKKMGRFTDCAGAGIYKLVRVKEGKKV